MRASLGVSDEYMLSSAPTHKGQLCQAGAGHWPGGFSGVAGLSLTVLLGSSSQLPGSRRRAEGVKLERPQPRSGEDERA